MELTLLVNKTKITCNEFVTHYIMEVSKAIMLSLAPAVNYLQSITIEVSPQDVMVRANKSSIEIRKLFVEDIIRNTLQGMVKTLKGAEDPKEIFIEIKWNVVP